jgi:hypothetical protein
VTVEWASKIGASYIVEFSTDLFLWIEVDDNTPQGGATSDRSTFTFEDIQAGQSGLFFRVRANEF